MRNARSVGFASLLVLLVAVRGVIAAQYEVTTGVDGADVAPGDGICDAGGAECTLRAAIEEANANPGEDVVLLPPEVITLSVPEGAVDTAASGDLDLIDDVRIVGVGSGTSIVDGGGMALLHVMPGVRAHVQGVTLRGAAVEGGSAMVNRGRLTIADSRLTDNGPLVGDTGAVIHNFATLVIRNATLDGNRGLVLEDEGQPVTLDGVVMRGNQGTIESQGGADLRIMRSEIAENRVGVYGCPIVHESIIRDNRFFGIACEVGGVVVSRSLISGNGVAGINSDGSVEVIDSTIRGNGAPVASAVLSGLGVFGNGGIVAFGRAYITNSTIVANDGYGVFVEHAATLTNVTVSGNRSINRAGGGIQLGDGESLVRSCTIVDNIGVGILGGEESQVVIRHTILAGNVTAEGAVANCSGPLSFDGGNLLSTVEGCQPGNGSDPVVAAALLGPLEDNGGSTLTHAPMEDSPAIDSGFLVPDSAESCSLLDQRGARRPGGERCDVGAVEILPSCGDGVVDAAEDCDDGNRDDGDCCSSVCRFVAELAGDCDGDGRVTISDLTHAVFLAVEDSRSLSCLAIDSNGDLDVGIAELITAVRNTMDDVSLACPGGTN